MRFDSYFELTKFIMGLCMIGYATPLIDYKEDMDNAGLEKHIHLYKCVLQIENRDIRLVFKDIDKDVYSILLTRR